MLGPTSARLFLEPVRDGAEDQVSQPSFAGAQSLDRRAGQPLGVWRLSRSRLCGRTEDLYLLPRSEISTKHSRPSREPFFG